MNVIYKYTNIDKSTGFRYYIGSKVECSVMETEDGRSILVSNKTAGEYYGSSTNPYFTSDLSRGDRFTVEILEEVPDADKIRRVEASYLKKYDVENSSDYYNLTNNTLAPRSNCSANAPSNFMGETVVSVARSRSSLSKRDSFAQQKGFSNFAELYFYVYDRHSEGQTLASISTEMGKNRDYFTRIFRENDVPRAVREVSDPEINSTDFIHEIRSLSSRGVSLHKISDLYSLELTTVRFLVNTSYKGGSSKGGLRKKERWIVGKINNMSDEEVITNVVGLVKDGFNDSEIAKMMNTSHSSVARIIRSYVIDSNVHDPQGYYGKSYWLNKTQSGKNWSEIH